MQAYQYLFIGTGAVIAGLGLWGQLAHPRRIAAYAADVASREPVIGQVMDYEFDEEDGTYTRVIEYEVNGQRYRIRGSHPVREKGAPLAPVRLAYRRDLRSDAIEVEHDFSRDNFAANLAIGTGLVFILTGAFG